MTIRLDWQAQLVEQLDQDQPQWYIDWADQQALQQFARTVAESPTDLPSATRALKWSTLHRMAHRILNCAISQKIVSVSQEPAK
jgi:hypothetical protein